MRTQTEQSKKAQTSISFVCLSSSPSNARIIHTAAKMAKVLHARFTAIYVQTDTVINDEDQSRLQRTKIQLAQRARRRDRYDARRGMYRCRSRNMSDFPMSAKNRGSDKAAPDAEACLEDRLSPKS